MLFDSIYKRFAWKPSKYMRFTSKNCRRSQKQQFLQAFSSRPPSLYRIFFLSIEKGGPPFLKRRGNSVRPPRASGSAFGRAAAHGGPGRQPLVFTPPNFVRGRGTLEPSGSEVSPLPLLFALAKTRGFV